RTPSPHTPQPASQQASPGNHGYGIPDTARLLVDNLTAAGVVVRWPFKGNGWFPVLSLINKSGVPAMVDHAVKAAARADVQSASYFMRGWSELPPLPPQNTPREEPAKPDYCGDPDCDPETRTREREHPNGLRTNYPCPHCHPNTEKDTAA
ncbi:MAG TPA: hypothetical protein VFH77_02595, partial [Streptomyces sp.]|nr:hypothetical protein [Streptomyces sp.]